MTKKEILALVAIGIIMGIALFLFARPSRATEIIPCEQEYVDSDYSECPTPTEVTPSPSEEPTPTIEPTPVVDVPKSDGLSDGLSDGRSDGLCSKPPCVTPGVNVPQGAPNTGRGGK